jgi:hypothetical protein
MVFYHLEHYMQALRRFWQYVLDDNLILILMPPPVSVGKGLTNMRMMVINRLRSVNDAVSTMPNSLSHSTQNSIASEARGYRNTTPQFLSQPAPER